RGAAGALSRRSNCAVPPRSWRFAMGRLAMLAMLALLLQQPLDAQRFPLHSSSSVGGWLDIPEHTDLEISGFDTWWAASGSDVVGGEDATLRPPSFGLSTVSFGQLWAHTDGAWGMPVEVSTFASMNLLNHDWAPL